MNIEAEIQKWHRWQLEANPKLSVPLRLTDAQATILLKEMLQYAGYKNRSEIEDAIAENAPWRIMQGMFYLGHSVVRIPPQGWIAPPTGDA